MGHDLIEVVEELLEMLDERTEIYDPYDWTKIKLHGMNYHKLREKLAEAIAFAKNKEGTK